MKLSAAILTLAAAGSVAAFEGRHNRHRHNHDKRATKVVTVAGPTVYAFELNGKKITQEEACAGIKNGQYQWADGANHESMCSSDPDPPAEGGQFHEQPSSPPKPTAVIEIEKPSAKPIQKSPKPKDDDKEDESEEDESYSPPSGGDGLDRDFPDGKLSCSEFPSGYGALNLKYLGLGGWSGIQYVTLSGKSFSSIHTGVDGDKCKDGAMCSYACPPGYQKSQWPKVQGENDESVGGLECSNGKLHLTNPSLSKKLCVEGVGGVYVENKMKKQVSVCRTDYPGTESEVVPLSAQPGKTESLTCPDANKYYSWTDLELPTTAQYYVNPAGVGTEKACQWGDETEDVGNFAPLNLGVGQDVNGDKWISIFPNKPTTDAILDFDVEIVGDNLGGECKYSNGQYTSLTKTSMDGCTVQVMSGKATFVFTSKTY